MHSSSKIIEVIGKLMVKFWVYLMKCSSRYRHTVSVSVYTYLSLYTLYLCVLSKDYNFNHVVYL